MVDLRAVLAKTLVYVAIFGASAALIFLWIHPSWLAFTSAGLLLFFGLVYFLISPSGTGHVLDNVVSYVIVTILVVVLASGVSRWIAKQQAKAEDKPTPAATDTGK